MLISCLVSIDQAYGSVHRLDDAMRVLKMAESSGGIRPGVRAYNAALAAFGRQGQVCHSPPVS